MPRFHLPFTTPRQLRQDIDDELACHLELSAEAHRRRGLSAEEARARAAARLGNLAGLQSALYRIDHRSVQEKKLMTWFSDLRHDLAFSLRRLRRRPLLFTLVLLTLAVGTGTVMTFFGAADIILLRPLPIAAPSEVMTIWRAPRSDPGLRTGLAPGTIMDLVEENQTFSTIAAAEPYGYDVREEDLDVSIGAWRVTSGFFDVMRIQPALGRLLQPDDFLPGGQPTVVVSHDFWRTRLQGDSSWVGRVLNLTGDSFLVVGVLPPEFPYAEGRQLYTPIVIAGSFRENRVSDYLLAYGRLRPGLDRTAALADLRQLASRSDARITATQTPREIQVISLTDAILGEVRSGLGLLALGAILLLVMTAASAAGLMLADTLDRQHELTIRASLGAGRGRMIRQLLTEAAMLSLAAGAAGFGLGVVGLGAFRRWAPTNLPRIAELGIDLRLVAISVAVTLLLGAFLGFIPARLVSRANLQGTLNETGAFGAGRGGRRARLWLVGTQVAMASLLLCAGGLLVRSWLTLQREDQGYQAQGIIAHEAHVWRFFPTPDARATFGRQATERLAAIPGVTAAALISSLPLAEGVGNDQARVSRQGQQQSLSLFAVVGTPEVFRTLETPLREGRGFTTADRGDGEQVAVVSRSAARLLYPDLSPVGELIEVAYSGPPVLRRIVGVVDDVRFVSPAEPGVATIYLPHSQASTGSFYITTRHAELSTGALASVQTALRELVPGASVGEVVNLGTRQHEAGGPRRFAVLLLTSFAAIALSLTAVGLFGLLAQGVRARRQELGVRMAVGAWPTALRNMILGEGLRLTGQGLAVGIVLLLLTSSVLRRVLYGVPVHDPLTIAGVTVLVLLVATFACWWPALQATRVDPMQALRRE